MSPIVLGEQLGQYLVENSEEVVGFNVVKGFLNLVLSDAYYMEIFRALNSDSNYGFSDPSDKGAVMVEYSSPNTNKPLHLGHIRNNLMGYSVAQILKAAGHKVYKTQIINDRGIHICKSMLAWQRYGEGRTPENSDLKGDKFVGNFYVKFDQVYKTEIAELEMQGFTKEEAKTKAPILLQAQEMLLKWEAGDADTVALWEQMNQWVYTGFEITYKNLGVDFDSYYYESQTYLLGKSFIDEGLKSEVFYRKSDGSVWCDLSQDGLDEKIVLRADGTAVYMTQDIGTAIQRLEDFPDVSAMVYTVGNEQDYHFKVLFLILKKLGFEWADNLFHLSYGMVDLPSGKMKSREGTVVDADDLISEMTLTAKTISQELGKLEGYSNDEKNQTYATIGLGALKYFILKVDPKKRILFDPEASVDFQGNTGPFIQYTYARIQAILRKSDVDLELPLAVVSLNEKEKNVLKQLEVFPAIIRQAATNYSPAIVANYSYDLVKEFNSFYQNISIFGAETVAEKQFRVQLCSVVGDTIKKAFGLLGIKVPERM
jgi:arginyl-tRNA synthetase